ncbi:MAG: YeeE/YedE thiosulfate transporter family protein [Longimicrobiales bacterium]|nr:YeeE/YedE thiosulfate transporter family protein [Longimicrobiales bacterium]
MLDLIREPWPWYVAGPLIGLVVPALLLLGNKMFGISANLRTVCALVLPNVSDYFRFDWRRVGGWNLAFALGIVLGGVLAGTVLAGPGEVAISAATRADLAALGIQDFQGMVPDDLISWQALLSWPGFVALAVGGFLVGFGAAYGGGCTSGHAITGLADLQLPSLIAVIGFFAGGLTVTHFVLPWLLTGLGGAG